MLILLRLIDIVYLYAMLRLVLLAAAVAGCLAGSAPIVAFNNEAQAAVRAYGIPSQISSKVRWRGRAGGTGRSQDARKPGQLLPAQRRAPAS